MAGNWPDLPSRKMAYHDDGTVVAGRYPVEGAPYENFYEWQAGANGLEELNDLDFQIIDEDWANKLFPAVGNQGNLGNKRTENVWIFPELRDIYGYEFILNQSNNATGGPGTFTWYTSPDTTNGIDGTWTEQGVFNGGNLKSENYPESWREGIIEITALAQRAIRVLGVAGVFTAGPTRFRSAFIFGTIAAGETPDRILFVDNFTGLEFTGPMDWGDVPRGTTLEWEIYLLNNSSTLQANTLVLDFVTLYNSSDTWFTIDDDGGGFATTANITSIAAGARYPLSPGLFTVRMVVPTTQPLGIFESILELSVPASWT